MLDIPTVSQVCRASKETQPSPFRRTNAKRRQRNSNDERRLSFYCILLGRRCSPGWAVCQYLRCLLTSSIVVKRYTRPARCRQCCQLDGFYCFSSVPYLSLSSYTAYACFSVYLFICTPVRTCINFQIFLPFVTFCVYCFWLGYGKFIYRLR